MICGGGEKNQMMRVVQSLYIPRWRGEGREARDEFASGDDCGLRKCRKC